MNIKEKIGLRIKEIRLRKNLTQEALAKIAGIERTFISHVEKGNRNVSVETLQKILVGLEMSFKTFFNNEIFFDQPN